MCAHMHKCCICVCIDVYFSNTVHYQIQNDWLIGKDRAVYITTNVQLYNTSNIAVKNLYRHMYCIITQLTQYTCGLHFGCIHWLLTTYTVSMGNPSVDNPYIGIVTTCTLCTSTLHMQYVQIWQDNCLQTWHICAAF